MRCPSCKAKSGALINMELRGSSLYVCPVFSCGAQVTLTDAGLQLERPPLPRQPSPFREVEEQPRALVKQRLVPQPPRPCDWCLDEFTPMHRNQKYCEPECGNHASAAQQQERKRRLAIAVEDVA